MRYVAKIVFNSALFTLGLTLVFGLAAPPLAAAYSSFKVTAETFVFDSAFPEKTRFGELEWRGGVILTSEETQFGGLSGVIVGPGGRNLIAISDEGLWVTADLIYEEARLIGLENVRQSRILGAPGEKLVGKVERDSEGLGRAINGDVLISFERYHRVARYDLANQGFEARATYFDLPDEIAGFSTNKGLESVGQFGQNSYFDEQVLVIAERYLDSAGNHSGWLLGANREKRISIMRSGEFDITDLEILPDGRVIILERRFSIFFGPAMRLRLISPSELISGEPIQGRVLLLAKSNYRIDNMEGLSVHTSPDSETILTLVSDNNFRDSQQTMIMQFALPPDRLGQ